MRTTSLDLRERILASYDNDEGTREVIARRFRVSLGLVKKLLQQRRHTGDIAPRHRYSGRKPTIVTAHRSQFRRLPHPVQRLLFPRAGTRRHQLYVLPLLSLCRGHLSGTSHDSCPHRAPD